jgi:hypothetical protein
MRFRSGGIPPGELWKSESMAIASLVAQSVSHSVVSEGSGTPAAEWAGRSAFRGGDAAADGFGAWPAVLSAHTCKLGPSPSLARRRFTPQVRSLGGRIQRKGHCCLDCRVYRFSWLQATEGNQPTSPSCTVGWQTRAIVTPSTWVVVQSKSGAGLRSLSGGPGWAWWWLMRTRPDFTQGFAVQLSQSVNPLHCTGPTQNGWGSGMDEGAEARAVGHSRA